MNFRTVITIPKQNPINYQQRILLLGSCFSENIGQKLIDYHLPCLSNPFGILYNPLSIANALQRLIAQKPFGEEELFEHHGLYHSWSHHGSFSTGSKEATLAKINTRYQEAASHLKQSDVLLITFGSSWVYEYQGVAVANCHKVAETEFTRRRLTVSEIVSTYTKLIQQLSEKNPHLQVIFSVSPIRYMRQGASENQTNKAILLLAIEELTEQFENVAYFPAYEIVLDELRDYRFFAEDMIHPSKVAIDYIWERFVDAFFDQETQKLLPKIEKLNKLMEHRPLHNDTADYKKFIAYKETLMAEFAKQYPALIF